MPQCPKCAQDIPADAPGGLCPSCAIRGALGGSEPSLAATAAKAPAGEEFAAPTAEEFGSLLPQFRVEAEIGRGGMGVVYRGLQVNLDRPVAIKLLAPHLAADPAFAERFTREARALARLSHPNIVAIYDFGRTGSYFYLVMELVDGANLRHVMRQGRIEPKQALEIVPQICDALQYAHDEGIVHRDIKPENILVDKRGRVKIADFGLAKLLSTSPGETNFTLTQSRQVMGTPQYMAPEQFERPLTTDHRADIYSLGVVFYEMLTGELPMGRFQPPSAKVQIDVRFDEVVLKSMEKEPERRYQHASDVKSSVHSITSTMPPAPTVSVAAAASEQAALEFKMPRRFTRWFTPATTVPAEAAADPSSRAAGLFPWETAFGLFCIAWLVTKMLWNVGMPGCWLAAFGMAALTEWLCLKYMQIFPVQYANWQKYPPSFYATIAAHVTNIVVIGLGFIFLIGGVFHCWDQQLFNSNSFARSMEQYEAQFKGKEYHLLQNLPAFSKDIPNVEMIGGMFGFQGGWGVGLGAHGPGYQWHDVVPSLFIGFLWLFGCTFGLISSNQFPPGTRRWPILWRHVRGSLQICLTAVLSVFMLGIFTELAYMLSRSGNGGSFRQYYCKADIDTVAKAIETWAAESGYAMGDKLDWRLNTVPKGQRVAQVRLREAWKPSPFDRWQSTWTSFRRVSPYLAFELLGSETPAETRVKVNGVMDCSPQQQGDGTCQGIPADLIAILEKLQSAQSQPAGEKVVPATAAPTATGGRTVVPQAVPHETASVMPAPNELKVDLGAGMKLEMVLIPAGEFLMGSPDSDNNSGRDEKPQHRVRISKPFYLGKYPVTREQWQAVMGNGPGSFKAPKNPAETVTWDDCQEFVKKLNAKSGSEGGTFQMPTEAQWEYACRSGTTTRYCFGDDALKLGEYAWQHPILSGEKAQMHPVGEKKPNAWGLYDMHGNVWEWCADWYDGGYYAKSPADDPQGPATGTNRVVRGGFWSIDASLCRSASRGNRVPGRQNFLLGFRVCLFPANK